ncbi:hypothetical protein AZE42_10881 [Rhizopogon vesiculosus]|uniref:Uncharacterized protein n=1 Tax=Rhizopogon vesiculosus TaxID=180088 RepID=A0A1J8Q297_9AGAM|nr:hypothetical protein AZE42_10881 [Rhizopogon vesiculosus]
MADRGLMLNPVL